MHCIHYMKNLDDMPKLDENTHPDMPGITVSEKGEYTLLANLNQMKAAGPDGIPCRLLQSVAKEIASALTLWFNRSFTASQISQSWKHALVQPIFRKGDRNGVAYYQPISLKSICCKLLEHIVRSEIISHLNLNNIITDAQHGFRKKRSCEIQLIFTVDDLAREIDKGGQTDMILLDLSKAFDRVRHQRRLLKPKPYGITGNTNK